MSRPSAAIILVALLAQAATPQELPASHGIDELEEVVVTGRAPGPPLWKLSRDGHVLWILPLIDTFPRKMEWDSARVEALVAQSQEFIARPRAYNGLATANPVTMLRMAGIARQATRLSEGRTLADVLPPDLHRRFSVLKTRYLPRNTSIETMTVSAAGRQLQREILERESLETMHPIRGNPPQVITSKLDKWLKRNKSIRRTNPAFGKSHALSSRDLTLVRKALEEASTTAAYAKWELACLEKIVAYFEADLERVKKRANAWAQGRTDDLVDPAPLHGQGDACSNPPLLPEDSPAMAKLRKEDPPLAEFLSEDRSESAMISREKWLTAAEAALARNTTTFSMLAVNDILDEGGLVARLEAKGYVVEVSAERPAVTVTSP